MSVIRRTRDRRGLAGFPQEFCGNLLVQLVVLDQQQVCPLYGGQIQPLGRRALGARLRLQLAVAALTKLLHHAIANVQRRSLVDTLTMLERAGLVHGDLKSTNFLARGSGFALIDVDGLKRKQQPGPVDAARLLANWPDGSAVRARVHAAIVRSPEFEGLVQ